MRNARSRKSVAISVAVWGSVAGIEWREHRGLFAVELVLGVASYALVHFRRRAPVAIALVVALTTVEVPLGSTSKK